VVAPVKNHDGEVMMIILDFETEKDAVEKIKKISKSNRSLCFLSDDEIFIVIVRLFQHLPCRINNTVSGHLPGKMTSFRFPENDFVL